MQERKSMILVITLIFMSCLVSINSQDCGVPGQACRDDANCCGGCCVSAVCIQGIVWSKKVIQVRDQLEVHKEISSYDRSCLFRDDPCATHSCPEESHCTVYLPENCPGCESYPVCTPFSGSGEY